MLGVLANLKVSEGSTNISAPGSASASSTTVSMAATSSSGLHQQPTSEQSPASKHKGDEEKEEEEHTWGSTVSDVSTCTVSSQEYVHVHMYQYEYTCIIMCVCITCKSTLSCVQLCTIIVVGLALSQQYGGTLIMITGRSRYSVFIIKTK